MLTAKAVCDRLLQPPLQLSHLIPDTTTLSWLCGLLCGVPTWCCVGYREWWSWRTEICCCPSVPTTPTCHPTHTCHGSSTLRTTQTHTTKVWVWPGSDGSTKMQGCPTKLHKCSTERHKCSPMLNVDHNNASTTQCKLKAFTAQQQFGSHLW